MTTDQSRNRFLLISILIGGIIVFLFLCYYLRFIQDDAYISFRYAANFLDGKGLIYNAGERVEGYTNFLWVILLAASKWLFGIDFIITARIFSLAASMMLIFLIYYLVSQSHKKYRPVILISILFLFISNLSLAYWTVSGLETMAFAALLFASLAAEYKWRKLTPAALVLATLIRPEGALIFGIILLNRMIRERKIPFRLILFYVIPLIPFAAFKLFYYGSFLPNSFYAKSGIGLEYLQSGLEYLWHFTSTIGVYGFIFLLPLLALRRLWKRYSLLYLYLFFYIIYIVWVGGDVLKVYRFFVPVVPVLYFLWVISLEELLSSNRYLAITPRLKTGLTLLIPMIFAAFSLLLSWGHINTYLNAEKGLVAKMEFDARKLGQNMGPDFSVAASTIGALGYGLMGHRVIDMLGLTDREIARHPEIIEGISSTWKERRFNSRYLLSQQPDFIVFSTGDKPSAPAERALFLHSEFRRKYAITGFPRPGYKGFRTVYKRQGQIDMSKDIVYSDSKFIDYFVMGYDFMIRNDNENAITYFELARANYPERSAQVAFCIANCYLQNNILDSTVFYINLALRIDSNCWQARVVAAFLAEMRGDTAAVLQQRDFLNRISPWVLDDTDIDASQ